MREAPAVCLTLWIATTYNLLFSQASPLVGHNDTLLRERRESCRFRCRSGECLGPFQFKCDGVKDCADGSDETIQECLHTDCPEYAVRCDYGGCVEGSARCDGKFDCADSSDEKLCQRIRRSTTCQRREFQCGTGSCIPRTQLCDGFLDCEDGSDETETACLKFPCLQNAFKCKYGGCVDASSKCDGLEHCADGSDESTEVCGGPDTIPQNQPTDTKPTPSTTTTTTITTTTSTTTSFTDLVNPIQDVLVCDPPRSSVLQTPTVSGCGMGPSKRGGIPFIRNGKNAFPGEFPWHVAIFRIKDYANICGGSLVSSRLVISAAHCFWDIGRSRPAKPEEFKLAAGKYFGNWSVQERGELRLSVEKFHINCFYKDKEKYYDDDIAAVILKEKVEFSIRIHPICIDWEQRYRQTITQGVVPGWGLNEKYEFPSELKKVTLPLVDINICRKSVPDDFAPYLSNRKFCAGFTNSTGVCNGDSGGGIVFESDDTNIWYLWGIVSAGVENPKVAAHYCSLQDYTLFSNVYDFMTWVTYVYR